MIASAFVGCAAVRGALSSALSAKRKTVSAHAVLVVRKPLPVRNVKGFLAKKAPTDIGNRPVRMRTRGLDVGGAPVPGRAGGRLGRCGATFSGGAALLVQGYL